MQNIIFLGTNNFALNVLKRLLIKNIKIKQIITKNDNKFGRGLIIREHVVSEFSQELNIPVYKTENINNKHARTFINNLNPDIIIMVEYGIKIKNYIIKIPKYGIINIHPSILPKFKGPIPIQHTILNNEKETGVSIIKINAKIDSGNILNIEKIKIIKGENYINLSKKLANLSVKCLLHVFNQIKNNTLREIEQEKNNNFYAYKINDNFCKINWEESAEEINKKIRAFYGIKKFYTTLDSYNIKILECKVIKSYKKHAPGEIIDLNKYGLDIMTGSNILRIRKMQFSGKKINKISDILNSKKNLFKCGRNFIK